MEFTFNFLFIDEEKIGSVLVLFIREESFQHEQQLLRGNVSGHLHRNGEMNYFAYRYLRGTAKSLRWGEAKSLRCGVAKSLRWGA
jgi:hypothetical protein